MATPSEKLAASLQVLKELQDKDNSLVIYGTTQLSRTHLDRLKLNGWLQEVLKGTPISSPKIKIGSKMIFNTAPISTENIAIFAFP